MSEAQQEISAGMRRGELAADSVINDIKAHGMHRQRYVLGYMLGIMSGLAGCSAAALGVEQMRELLKSVADIGEKAQLLIEGNTQGKVH